MLPTFTVYLRKNGLVEVKKVLKVNGLEIGKLRISEISPPPFHYFAKKMIL